MSLTSYKGILFDLDGVLINTKDLHYTAFARALSELAGIKLSKEFHTNHLCGLPTSEKLKVLQVHHQFSDSVSENINSRKQEITSDLIEKENFFNQEIYDLVKKLSSKGLKLGVCSNSTRITLDRILKKLKITQFMTVTLSNNDVGAPKPSPEIYLKGMSHLGISPAESLIVEDSRPGIEAARSSGADLLIVNSPEEMLKTLPGYLQKKVS